MIILLILCIAMLLAGGVIGLSSLSMLADNGIKIKSSADKLLEQLRENFQNTALMIDLQAKVTEFTAVADKKHLAEIEKITRELENRFGSKHKKDIAAFKSLIGFFSVRRESLNQNLNNMDKAQDSIARELNAACQDKACASAVPLCLSALNRIRPKLNYIVNGVSVAATLLKEQEEFSGEIDKIADELDKMAAETSSRGKKDLLALRDAFYNLDDAVSSVAAIKVKVIKSRGDIEASLNKLEGDFLSADSKVSADTSVLADKGLKLARQTTCLMASGIGIGILLLIIIGLLIIHSITLPLNEFKGLIEKISAGDLTVRLKIKGKDELTRIALEFNNLSQSLKRMIRETMDGVETMISSSAELNSISGQLAAGADNTAGKANNVTTAAEEMNTNMNSVAAAMEQASVNVNTVASGSEEMSVTVGEIAKNAETARDIVGQAVNQGKNAAVRIDELGKAAQEIGKVTDTINDISSQTNLLALNATIEAARAGEAGKGFAVVANEIKDLAQQTAAATGEIAAKIKGIQDSTGATVTEINEIARINDEVDGIVTTIATAVDEQASTTREIAENIAQTSRGITEVNENVVRNAEVSGTIAREIADVNESAGEMSNSSAQVRRSAEELSRLAEKLKELMGRFKV